MAIGTVTWALKLHHVGIYIILIAFAYISKNMQVVRNVDKAEYDKQHLTLGIDHEVVA
jgi:hypothetical protein